MSTKLTPVTGPFPRTTIGGLSVSRMVMGTNNIMGGSHRTMARDLHIKEINHHAESVAAIVEAYLASGVDTIVGRMVEWDFAIDGIRLAEQRTGKKVNVIELAVFDVSDTAEGRKDAAAMIKLCKDRGIDIVLPLHFIVEKLVDKGREKIHRIEDYLYMIRDNGMIPGLSAHMPEIITYADGNGYDVETYIQIYNGIGFLMQVETDWVMHVIQKAKKPVMTIKPLAAGRLLPVVGLAFVWSTIRDQDMVTVGTTTPDEAREVIDISLSLLERRHPDNPLQRTRSKASLE